MLQLSFLLMNLLTTTVCHFSSDSSVMAPLIKALLRQWNQIMISLCYILKLIR